MKTVRAIVARIADSDPASRRAAAAELSKRRSPSAREALTGCLDHRDPEIRRLAASALAHFGEPGDLPVVLKAARLEGEPRAQVTLWRAVGKLVRQRGRLSDVRRLAAFMVEPNFPDDCMGDACAAALHILAAHPDRLPEGLIVLLQAPEVLAHPLIQTALQKAIATNSGQKLARSLAPAYLDLLQDDSFGASPDGGRLRASPDGGRLRAYHPAFIEALGNMREVRAIGTLLKLFESVPALQDKVLGALSLIGVENLEPAMATAVRLHEEIYFRTPSEEEFVSFFFESAQRLAAMGAAGVPILMRLLDHPNGAMRQNARFALEAIKDPAALMSMLRIAENRRDPDKTRLAWELVSRNHPDHSLQGLAREQLGER